MPISDIHAGNTGRGPTGWAQDGSGPRLPPVTHASSQRRDILVKRLARTAKPQARMSTAANACPAPSGDLIVSVACGGRFRPKPVSTLRPDLEGTDCKTTGSILPARRAPCEDRQSKPGKVFDSNFQRKRYINQTFWAVYAALSGPICARATFGTS
jgi:hypothetical protein